METKQTATKYLIQEIKNDSLVQAKSTEEWNKVFQIALQMEREQITDAWNSCGESIMTEEFDNAEQYYKETYGGQDE
jgi:predicted transcriptional regulator